MRSRRWLTKWEKVAIAVSIQTLALENNPIRRRILQRIQTMMRIYSVVWITIISTARVHSNHKIICQTTWTLISLISPEMNRRLMCCVVRGFRLLIRILIWWNRGCRWSLTWNNVTIQLKWNPQASPLRPIPWRSGPQGWGRRLILNDGVRKRRQIRIRGTVCRGMGRLIRVPASHPNSQTTFWLLWLAPWKSENQKKTSEKSRNLPDHRWVKKQWRKSRLNFGAYRP